MARSDNDSWDLATSVGATATVVAAQRAIAARNSLIDDPYAEPLVRAVNADAVTRLLDGGTHQEDGAFTVQQAAEAMAVRTRFYDELFTRAAAAGVRQAVILASGLDTRAYRLRWPTGTIVYELDQPAVIEFKTETLGNLGAHPTAQRRAIGIDLREDWPKALLANGFDRSRPAAWIAEGLTIYLPPEAQDQLFDNITRLSAPGSHVATEYVPDAAVFSDNRSERVLAGYRRSGLDTELSDLVYAGRRSDVLEFLTARGWEMSSQTLEEAYAAHGFALPDNDMFSAFAEARIVTGILT
ncbi:class I SAM-dependent methyltransferase [Mycolicibacterium celeriflavum]|uniref:S-adenosyl-L-methionine-dependent methyltransferase n=1 Tax=Mycolicibacterium celeriflavum TaxID=1249101 RepID=A0A1X0BXY5_MYCCF|nr:class I SAM-dependent methyltransferase [Mycolicibacterium celeriflavum]MCV7237150.1 class I SAM-dependent methyltransferase [Mycolicibacterium celeriflavum]ORA49242.1 SAM-dependent methyltransferase [Mycolicibacterium celeriflavum]BBY41847.1 putative S-adenosyl-L-methionine-dependent methyltransferase [Mycolicibacterium celeriflavum]